MYISNPVPASRLAFGPVCSTTRHSKCTSRLVRFVFGEEGEEGDGGLEGAEEENGGEDEPALDRRIG